MYLKTIILILLLQNAVITKAQYQTTFASSNSYVGVVRDTVTYSHSKYNPIVYGFIVREFRMNQRDYNAFNAAPLNDHGFSLVRDSIKEMYYPHILELVPDAFDGYKKVYDPNTLFVLDINKDFKFGFPSPSYNIAKSQLIFLIQVKEILPNASRHFRYKGKIIATFYTNETIIESKEYVNFIPQNELKSYVENGLDRINIKLINSYGDFIEMNFFISL